MTDDPRSPDGPASLAEALQSAVTRACAAETAHRHGRLLTELRDDDASLPSPWAAPEIVDGRSTGSVAGNVYALGAHLWAGLTGHPPFRLEGGDDSPRALTARILHAAAPPTGRADVPTALESLLAHCLAKAPADRPASALDVATQLQRIESDAGLAPTPLVVEGDPAGSGPVEAAPAASVPEAPGPVAGPAPAGRSWASRPAARWVAAALVGLVVVLVGVRWLSSGSHGGDPAPTPPPGSAHGRLPAPVVTGKRIGDSVQFLWHTSDTPLAGDSFQWHLRGHRALHLTTATTVTLRSTGRLCLLVRLSRAGHPPSSYATACV